MKPVEISQQKILLVEGKDDEEFFEALIRHLGLSGVQAAEFGGKHKLIDNLPTILARPGFDFVRSLAVVRDADDNLQVAIQSVQNALKRNHLPVPGASGLFKEENGRKVGIYIVPGDGPGMLEDLCLRTVANHPAMECVNAFMSCLDARLEKRQSGAEDDPGRPYFPNMPSKAKCQAYLAARYETVPRLGHAAKRKYFNFDHEALGPLRQFLSQL